MSRHKTDIEKDELCLAWKQSNLTKTEFCKERNISRYALYQTLKSSNNSSDASNTSVTENTPKPNTIKFLQINNSTLIKQASYAGDSSFEIATPNGIIIKINAPQNNLSIFLQELLKWK